MGGRITWRQRRTPNARALGAATLRPATVRALSAALGRPLAAGELALIGERLALLEWHRDTLHKQVRRIDIAATLRAFASENDPQSALRGTDATSRALLVERLLLDMGRRWYEALAPEAADIRAAAALALQSLPRQRTGPRATWLHLAAADARDLWLHFGGPPSKPAARGDYATPIVRFACALFEAAGAPRSPAAVAKLLRAK